MLLETRIQTVIMVLIRSGPQTEVRLLFFLTFKKFVKTLRILWCLQRIDGKVSQETSPIKEQDASRNSDSDGDYGFDSQWSTNRIWITIFFSHIQKIR